MSTIEHLLEIEGDVDRLAAKIRAAIQKEREKPVIVVPPVEPDPGTLGIPAVDLQSGIDAMRAGDTLLVEPGVFYGAILVRDKPGCTIKARVPGTVMISGLWKNADQGNVDWEPLWGTWAEPHGDSHLASVDGSFLMRFGGDRPVDNLKAETFMGYKKPGHGYAFNQDKIFVRLPDDADPRGKSIKFCDKPAQNIVQAKGSPNVTLNGFVIEGAGDADAVVCDEASEGFKAINCVFTHSRRAVRMPHNARLSWCEYRFDGFWDYYLDLVRLNGAGTAALFDFAKKHWTGKNGALLEGGMCESIYAGGSKGCEISHCYMHSTFDGQRLGAFVGVDSHHNVYARNIDNHIEFEAAFKTRTTAGNHEHHSLLLDCPAGPVSHQDSAGNMQGPHYVSHSIIANREIHAPFMIKLLGVKGNIVYAHNELELKAGRDENWGNMNAIAAAMKNESVSNKLKLYNNVIRGDRATPMRGTPTIKGTARARNTTEAVDTPAADLGPIQPHAFMGPNIADDKDWPRPMRTVFAS
jgi:hypothetical protein